MPSEESNRLWERNPPGVETGATNLIQEAHSMDAVAPRPRVLAWLLALAALANAAAAALTLLIPGVLTGPAVTNGNARGTALVMLLLGVPLLLASVLLERRESRWASPIRLGALAYLSYNGFLLLFATPFNPLFLVYVVALSATVFAFGVSLLRADAPDVAERLPRIPARVVGGYILLIVVLNTLMWLRTVVPATFAGDPTSFLDGTGVATNPVFVQDLVFWLPAAAVIGWLVWTRRAWGALLAGGYLLFGLLESIGVAVDQWFGATADPTTPHATFGAVYLFVGLALIGAGALGFYARARGRGLSATMGSVPQHSPA